MPETCRVIYNNKLLHQVGPLVIFIYARTHIHQIYRSCLGDVGVDKTRAAPDPSGVASVDQK